MSNKPSVQDIVRLASSHYGLPMAEIFAAMQTPMHPATLRDEFAGKAMQALVSKMTVPPATYAAAAYELADAMLKARQA